MDKKPDTKELLSAPEKVMVHDVELTLETYIWRDAQPGINKPSGGKPLIAVLKIKAGDSKQIPEGVIADVAWIVRGDEIWKSSIDEIRSRSPIFEAVIRDGPKWDPNEKVEAIVQLIDKNGKKHLLRASNQKIHLTS